MKNDVLWPRKGCSIQSQHPENRVRPQDTILEDSYRRTSLMVKTGSFNVTK